MGGLNKMTWISVTDQMPEINLRVLTYCPNRDDPCKYEVGFLDAHGDWNMSYREEFLDTISHWMELPAPPKEYD